MIRVWRTVNKRYAKTAFSGEGSFKRGGRWSSRRNAVVYTSDSLSLATLELIVHGVSVDTIKNQVFIAAEIPEAIITELDTNQLPSNWRSVSTMPQLQVLGDQWIKANRFAVLKVPSAVIPIEFSYVINLNHIDFKKIHIGPAQQHALDERFSLLS